PQVDPGLLQNGLVRTEVGHEAEIDKITDGALEDRAGPAHEKSVILIVDIPDIGACVGLYDAANAQLKARVARAQIESVRAEADERRGRGLTRRLLLRLAEAPFELRLSGTQRIDLTAQCLLGRFLPLGAKGRAQKAQHTRQRRESRIGSHDRQSPA